MSLRDALGNPNNVAALLFLQTNERVEDTKVELLHEGLHINLHLHNVSTHQNVVKIRRVIATTCLFLKELVLQSLLSRVSACPSKDGRILLQTRARLAHFRPLWATFTLNCSRDS